jgi:LacI family transcriptional regulator
MVSIKRVHTRAHKVAAQIAEDICQGKFDSGVLLPPESELAASYAVSRITLRKSLTILSEKGQLRRLPQGGALAKHPDPAGPGGQGASDASGLPQTQRKLTLGKIIPAGPNYPEIQRIVGAKRYAEANNVRFVHFLPESNEEALNILSRMDEYELDGAVAAPHTDAAYVEVFARLAEQGFPLVLQNRLGSLPGISSVMSCDETAAYQATHYLIKKYQQPVYYICDDQGELASLTPERHLGYARAMRDAAMGSQVDSHLCRKAIKTSNSDYWAIDKVSLPGFYAADALFARATGPFSIFCANDFDACGVYDAAKKHGLIVGQDVRVVGFGDYPLASLLRPTLTTCHASAEELGYEEMRLLHRLIKKEVRAPMHIRLPMELVIRESA